jgi:hypothetical protein
MKSSLEIDYRIDPKFLGHSRQYARGNGLLTSAELGYGPYIHLANNTTPTHK